MLVTLTATALGLPALSAQEPTQSLAQLHHTSWTMEDGAPADVESLAQTADGYLWLGSGNGLFRFDGARFEVFEPGASQSMPSTNVSALRATRDSGLWVGYRFGGASLVQRGAIRNYGESDGLPRGSVLGFEEDSDGTIWIATTGGLARFVESGWRRAEPPEGLPDGAVTAILVDRARRFWVSADSGIYMRPSAAARFERVAPSFTPPGLTRLYTFLQEEADGAIWGSSVDRGLVELAPSREGDHQGAARPRVGESGAMLIDRNDELWLAHTRREGIERFRLHPRDVTPRAEEQQLAVSRMSGQVLGWLEDREGNVWAGTTGGLDRFRRAKLNRVEVPDLQENIALAPADSGAVWVGSDGRHLLRVGARIEEFSEIPKTVDVAYRDRAGVVWIGSPTGLWRSVGRGFARVDLPDVFNAGVQAITRDAAGSVWVSIVRSGVYRRAGERWVPFGDYAGLPREPAIVLTTDDSGRTWFGYTANRVALLQDDSVRVYTTGEGVSVGNVLAIHVRGGHVWVGGEFGLARLVGGRFQRVTGRNGTVFRGTSGIVETPEGELWLHGSIGITRIPADEVLRVMDDSTYQVDNERLDFRDGLNGTARQIRPQPTVIAGTDGRLWFATSTSVAWLDPRAVPRNPVIPPVVIRRLTAGNKSYPIGPDLHLPVRTTALRIEYTALSLSIPERVRFRYQLVGSDTAWQDAGARREAFYTNLAPGSYRFRVIAANDDGLWNRTGAALDITIPPSFAQTRWFLGVWVFALAGVVLLAYLARMRQVAGGLRLRYEAALAERTRIAQELHDTLLQGFTGITLQLRAIERSLPRRPQESAQALNKVLASADTALRDARHMIWDMRAVELEGRDLGEALEVAARLAMTDSSADLAFTVRGDRRRLPLAIETTALRVGREAVVNAVKHAAPRTVEVNLEYAPRSLTLRVADDGTGIQPGALDAAAAGEHLGIAGMRDRAQRGGGTLDVTSEPGRGTTVSLSLPIRQTA